MRKFRPVPSTEVDFWDEASRLRLTSARYRSRRAVHHKYLMISDSIANGLVVGAYRPTVLPCLSIKNLEKFHLISLPARASNPLSGADSFRCFQSGFAFAPFTSVFSISGNLAPYFPANALISAALPGSCPPNSLDGNARTSIRPSYLPCS